MATKSFLSGNVELNTKFKLDLIAATFFPLFPYWKIGNKQGFLLI